jgi:hypothetical protein
MARGKALWVDDEIRGVLQSTDQVAGSSGAAENAPVHGRGGAFGGSGVAPAPQSVL